MAWTWWGPGSKATSRKAISLIFAMPTRQRQEFWLLIVVGVTVFLLLIAHPPETLREINPAIDLGNSSGPSLYDLETESSSRVSLELQGGNRQGFETDPWAPIGEECTSPEPMKLADPFPASFELEVYRTLNFNSESWKSANPNALLDETHYLREGRHLGLTSTRGQSLRTILNQEIVPQVSPALELGPFCNPVLVANDNATVVKYFDVLDQQGLLDRANRTNYPVVRTVPIDYISPNGDLTSVPDKRAFQLILSSHVLEHQLNLVFHLNAVADLLADSGGYYLAFVPDKRYCFDHFVSESTIADVLDDHENQRHLLSSHTLRSVIEHRAVTTHNVANRHWKTGLHQDHGPQYRVKSAYEAAVKEYLDAKASNAYVDVHNYQFTPQGLAHIVDMLYEMRLTNLRVHRLYETVIDQFEFAIVLRKC
jgi:predicted SAM-dependent methyltransferase